ncbi:hypothetical protein V2J09_004746 [Rumex salicifolius]
MTCRGFLEFILKLLNFLMTLAGLAMIGYGIYLFVEYEQSSANLALTLGKSGDEVVQLGRPFLSAVALNSSIWTDISSAWSVGKESVLLKLCILMPAIFYYAVLVILLILVELGCAGFMFFDSSWEDDIPTDSTGYFDEIYDFLKDHLSVVKWVALGIVVLEAVLFLLALLVRSINKPAEYDSDEEIINPRQSARQPLISPTTGVPVAGAPEQRPGRIDAWSARMREKYGLNTSDFTYDPNDPARNQQSPQQQPEEKGRCTIIDLAKLKEVNPPPMRHEATAENDAIHINY